MITVLDASVAIKWFVPSEGLRTQASSVLMAIRDQPSQFLVPELFFNEMLAVLCRTSGASAEELGHYLTDLEQLGLPRVGNGHELLQTAMSFARSWKISGYDAIYAATAHLCSGRWLTADRKAAKRIKDRNRVITLSEWQTP